MHILKKISKKRRIFNNIFAYFLYSILIVIMLSLVINIYYFNLLQTTTKKNYLNTLATISKTVDTSIYELLQTNTLLESSKDLYDILYTDIIIPNKDYYKISNIFEILTKLRTTKSFINNVYIMYKSNNILLSGDGTSSIDEFFDITHFYDEYDTNFWLNIQSDNKDFKILKSSNVWNKQDKIKKDVIPIVQFESNGHKFLNILVVDVNKDFILDLLRKNRLTDNSTLIVYDNINDEFYKTHDNKNNLQDEMFYNIVKDNRQAYKYKYDSINYLIIKYNNTNNLATDNYEYIAVVPYSDFIKESFKILTFPILIVCASILLALIVSFLLSKKIYTPISNVIKVLSQNSENLKEYQKENNEFEFLNKQINKIINDNKKLTMDLSVAIPYVCERYLFSVLNDNQIFPENEVKEFLKTYNFAFKHKYFCVIMTNINFSKSFYEKFSKKDFLEIHNKVFLASKDIFSDDIETYTISIGSNKICIIINFENPDYEHKIVEHMEKFHSKISIDNNLINICSGIGKIYKELKGLHQSYQEALKASLFFFSSLDNSIKVYESENTNINFSYTIDEENKLFNYLVKGDKEKVDEMLSSIVNKNISENVSETGFTELYLQIYNTALRVLNLRHISPYDLLGNDYPNVTSNIHNKTCQEIYEGTKLILDSIVDMNCQNNSTINAQDLKNYLELNYKEDIYLDKIADVFNMSSKYLSKQIKKSLGMPFQKYLSRLRISKAKELLVSSNKNIDDISMDVGFNSRHTFIRMFKLLEGITPSEFRKHQ